MGMKPAGATPAAEPRKLEAAPAPAPAPKVVDRSVKGQVAMHAIITGYEVASHLAATLAASPEKVKEVLHSLAAEVAAKIEAYTFHD